MYLLALTAEERKELCDTLEISVAELRAEISHTDGYEYSEELKSRRAVLEGILRRLARTTAVEHEHGGGSATDMSDPRPAT